MVVHESGSKQPVDIFDPLSVTRLEVDGRQSLTGTQIMDGDRVRIDLGDEIDIRWVIVRGMPRLRRLFCTAITFRPDCVE